MNASTVDMGEVMRLTRAGRLFDATALLQAGLGGGRTTAQPAEDDKRNLVFERSKIDDDAWKMPGGTMRQRSRPRPVEPKSARSPGPSFETRTVTNAAGTLAYKLYVPSSRAEIAAPLVVMLHGCTQDPDDFAAGTRMNALAERHGFIVAYPAQTTSANQQRCWNWFKGGEQRRDTGEPSLIADATRQILAQHTVDPRRVYVAGLSAGGAAAAIMGCAYPDLYAGVGVHSGLACGAASDLPSAFKAMRAGGGRGSRPESLVPTIVFHGTADRTVGASNAGEVFDQVAIRSGPALAEHGTTAAGMRFVRTVRHAADGRPVGEQWMVEGAGHAWFGGDPKGTYTDPRGPDASAEMLRFFGIIPEAS